MDDRSRHAQGMAVRRQVLGEEHAGRAIAPTGPEEAARG
jgi:hypothetical protein